MSILDFETAINKAGQMIRDAARHRLRIKRFKISQEQAIEFAAELARDMPTLFGNEDVRSRLLSHMLSGQSKFANVPIKVIG